MKKLLQLCIFATMLIASNAFAADATFNPNAQYYDVNAEGTLSLWGVPEAGSGALKGNPDNGWPTKSAIASWVSLIMKAQELNMVVVVGYDPVTFDIWYVAKPR
jgi:hypothetical protein